MRKQFRFTAEQFMGIDMSDPGPSLSRYGLMPFQAKRIADEANALLDAHLAMLERVWIGSRECPTGGLEACWISERYSASDATALLFDVSSLLASLGAAGAPDGAGDSEEDVHEKDCNCAVCDEYVYREEGGEEK